jgi:phosphoribosyl-AMP cyclohydrolase
VSDTTQCFPLSVSIDLDSLKFASDGLIPAVVIDSDDKVLMVAYMDRNALERSISSGRTWFYSRSRKSYWAKGETSGNIQKILEIKTDCDLDTLLVKVEQMGQGACHTGSYSCFFNNVAETRRW